MYLFGCPRTGNGALARYIHQIMPNLYRVVHNKDLVPHVPPIDFQYLHPAYEVLYDEEMKNYQVCNESGEDSSCSDRFAPDYSFNDHTTYWVKTDSTVC